ncbi:MAG: hypothetical protein QOI63_1782, partial [Thermoplasmata archaeon]|nr:hypothetical protein [Thermoplasmata archaeon]
AEAAAAKGDAEGSDDEAEAPEE